MNRLPLTAIVAAKNEQANIDRCLAALNRAERIVVVDSLSHDATEEISRKRGAEVLQFKYKGGYPKKRQWALNTLDVSTPWIFLIDADEVVPTELWDEIETALADSSVAGFEIIKGFHFLGRRFRFGGFSHSAVLLFRNGKARFEHILDEPPDAPDMEIHERVIVDGEVRRLNTPLIHEDFKGLASYIAKHNDYSTWEAGVRYSFLTRGYWGNDTISAKMLGNTQERRRFLKGIVVYLPFESTLWFLYHYVFRLGFFEGRPGLIASQIRASYISQVKAKIFELRWMNKDLRNSVK